MRAALRLRVRTAGRAQRAWLSTAVDVHRSEQAPKYSRELSDYPNVIMHLGVGGFHRSHQAHYLHELLERRGREAGWAICGVGLMPADAKMGAALRSQDHMYSVLSQGSSGSSLSVVGSIMDFILVPDDPSAATERLADPSVKIVSLTITEKGYCLAVDGHLDQQNGLVRSEMPPGAAPASALGLIYAALVERQRRGVPPFTVLSCDNMPGNGTLFRRTLLEFIAAKGEAGDEEGEAARNRPQPHATARSRPQPPATVRNRLPPSATACYRPQPPATVLSRLLPSATACYRPQPPATVRNHL